MRGLYLSVFLGALATAAWGESKPDFNGTWKMDPLRSRFQSMPAPKGQAMKIEEQEQKIKITLTSLDKKTESTETLELPADGTEQKVTLDGQPATASARWEDSHLVLEVTRQTASGPVTETRRMRLGDKGKMMTTVFTVKDHSGEKTAYGFYVKE